MHWNLRVKPDGQGDVTLTLKPTTDCATLPGVCRKSDNAMVHVPAKADDPGAPPRARWRTRWWKSALTGVYTRLRGDAEPEPVECEDRAIRDLGRHGDGGFGLHGHLGHAHLRGRSTTSKTVSVPVLNDAHDDGGETVTLTLSNPAPSEYVRISDATATGTITNTDPMPKAWLAALRAQKAAGHLADAIAGLLGGDTGTLRGVRRPGPGLGRGFPDGREDPGHRRPGR